MALAGNKTQAGKKKAFEEVSSWEEWEEGAELIMPRLHKAGWPSWEVSSGSVFHPVGARCSSSKEREVVTAEEHFSSLRGQSGTAEGGTGTSLGTAKGTAKGRDSFLSCPEGNCSDQGPAAATQELVTFWGIKAHPRFLLLSRSKAVPTGSLGRGQEAALQ